MYIAMNHFHVTAGMAGAFEDQWRNRKSYLDEVPGFVSFALLRGKDDDDGAHRFASHTVWENRQTFLDWTHSDAFKKAHGSTGSTKSVLLAHPEFKGWDAVDLG